MGDIIRFGRPHWKPFVAAFLLMSVMSFMSLGRIVLLMPIITRMGLTETPVEAQTEQVMKNLKAVLSEAGTSFDAVVKTMIFIKDMGDFPKVNEVYGSFIEGTPPARACVEVARLPKDVLVEIEAIAHLG